MSHNQLLTNSFHKKIVFKNTILSKTTTNSTAIDGSHRVTYLVLVIYNICIVHLFIIGMHIIIRGRNKAPAS